ncbi:hypothetical protein NPIL_435921 [Nephila pilipes]|uniref:Uncharacterized protein n=1 Tax=Nephila pilipes TaxID=299642 RepID=A0A8X6UKY1_NEPPI|nr:hypothetical protein NPIL_435921 [Nephila pilipes]
MTLNTSQEIYAVLPNVTKYNCGAEKKRTGGGLMTSAILIAADEIGVNGTKRRVDDLTIPHVDLNAQLNPQCAAATLFPTMSYIGNNS